MYTLAIVALLRRAREQVDYLILRTSRTTTCSKQDHSQRTTSRIKQLSRRRNFAERLNHLLPRRIQLRSRNLPLTCEYLPQSNVGLKSPQSICAQYLTWRPTNCVSHSYKTGDGFIIQIRELGEDQVPVAVLRKPVSKQTHRLCR